LSPHGTSAKVNLVLDVQLLVVVHLFAKIGFVAHEATSLKMIEKGLKREDLAAAALIDFPFQILGGWLAAKWSRGDKPLRPWLYAFWPRYLFGVISVLTVLWFPPPPISAGFFAYLIGFTVISSFTSTVQFVGISAFHTRISDPLIGGTYMTVSLLDGQGRASLTLIHLQLLNTFTNLGGTWPKWFVLKGVDWFTIATCKIPEAKGEILVKGTDFSKHPAFAPHLHTVQPKNVSPRQENITVKRSAEHATLNAMGTT
jgi:MFS transporter, PAT family, solute carrier family 33 (acetyl-CoA transportor), member 1